MNKFTNGILIVVLQLLLVYIACSGCLAPQMRTGEFFVATKRQFQLVDEARHANDSRMNPGAVLAPFAIVGGVFIGSTYAPAADVLCMPYDIAMRWNRTIVRVVDENGSPASGVSVLLSCIPVFDTVVGETDSKGEVRAPGDMRVFGGLYKYRLDGAGYYSASWDRTIYLYGVGDVGAPFIGTNNFINLRIKRKVNPVPMAYGRVNVPREKRDALGYYDFDCEYGTWLPPYGSGHHADLRFELKRINSLTNIMQVTALGHGNGFVNRKYDISIKLGSDHRVPDDADFSKNCITHRRVYDEKGRLNWSESEKFKWDEYFIMRLRSRLDADGNVTEARYGKMVFVQGSGCLAQTYLNEDCNEKSLEALTGTNPAYQRRVKEYGKRPRWSADESIGCP